MSALTLPGCRSEPLGSYLAGLGLWRAVVRLLDPGARGHWDRNEFVLTSELSTVDELAERLATKFTPLPNVSPWNSGSGFADKGRNADKLIAGIRDSGDPRLAELVLAVQAADTVVAEAHARGLTNTGSGTELWAKQHKPTVIALARNLLPDNALPWVDAAVVLGRDGKPAYNRLLGTGANFGAQDLSFSYLTRALAVVDDPDIDRLRAALTGDESIRYQRDAVGQFDPGRAGGMQSSPWEKADDKGFVNLWAFLLTIEGAVLFAASVVRRFGANTVNAAVPFVVAASTAGSATDAVGEQALGEVWTPMWDRPAMLVEVEQLLAEGRAEWRGSAARNGLDFARAISSLGVDRGLSKFTRHIVVERHGQNPLAVPAGVVEVRQRPEVRLLADLDGWLAWLRGRDLPTAVSGALRAVDAAQFTVATGGGPQALRDVLITVGRLHRAVSRSGAARALVQPLSLRRPREWLDALPDTAELRLATALASGHDDGPTLRALFTPALRSKSGSPQWTGRPAPVVDGGDVVTRLAAAHRRRAIGGAIPEPDVDLRPAVLGVLSGFRYGRSAPLSDVAAFVAGDVDEAMIDDLLYGLLLADWHGNRGKPGLLAEDQLPGWWSRHVDASDPVLIPPDYGLLAPFYATDPLWLRRTEEQSKAEPMLLRPGREWLTWLCASHIDLVIEDARRRLKISGIERTVLPNTRTPGPRLAAALLIPVSQYARTRALRAIADLPKSGHTKPTAPAEGVSA